MFLKELIKGTDIRLKPEQEDIEVKNIKINLDEVREDDLYFDLKGNQNMNEVLAKKPAFVVRYGRVNRNEGKNLYSSEDIRRNFALISKNAYGNACDSLKIIGVTGTNGKTSTVKLVADILRESGKKVATIGTMGCNFLGTTIDTGFTTPDPHTLHELFYKLKSSGVTHVVMEVSAHAIFLKKLEGIKFEALGITNITQDHLDFFRTMENYARTKLGFFDVQHVKQGIVCVDDKWCRTLLDSANIPLITYGIEYPSDIFAIDIASDFYGTQYICNCMDNVFEVDSKLVGGYNVLNLLCATGICSSLGVSCEDIKQGISKSESEVGRFNVINFNGINVVIDYAHTPDGLEKILTTAKKMCKNDLVVVFGCGGNRDTLKRPIMGAIAEKYGDKIYLTSDNPRFEEPRSIIADIEKGMKGKYEVQEDRKKAIEEALSNSKEGDCVIIAGKGGEKYQDIKGHKYPYSDFEQVYSFFRNNISVYQQEVTYDN